MFYSSEVSGQPPDPSTVVSRRARPLQFFGEASWRPALTARHADLLDVGVANEIQSRLLALLPFRTPSTWCEGIVMSSIKKTWTCAVQIAIPAIAAALLPALGLETEVVAQHQELQLVQPGARRDDSQARSLFNQVTKAYCSLQAYSDQGEFVIAMKADGKSEKQALPLKLTLVRPNKLDVEAGDFRI